MRNLFKRHRKVQSGKDSGHELIASRIAGMIKGIQQKWAGWMGRQSEKLSNRSKWVALALFSLVMAGTCIFIIRSALQPVGQTPDKIARIKVPLQPKPSGNLKPGVSEGDYLALKNYRLYMDSLARSPTGVQQYRQFRNHHPGLLDSIKVIEKMYQSQLK